MKITIGFPAAEEVYNSYMHCALFDEDEAYGYRIPPFGYIQMIKKTPQGARRVQMHGVEIRFIFE